MVLSIIPIIVILCGLSLLNAIIFFIVIEKRLPFKEVFKLTSTAIALNRLFFTGSGYLAGSYFQRSDEASFRRILSTFFVMEFMVISPWLVMGLYFSTKLAASLLWVVLVILVAFVIALWLKRNKLKEIASTLTEYAMRRWPTMFILFPLVIVYFVLVVFYYRLLFGMFDFYPSMYELVKIVSISFTAGYLSFTPGGMGFRDAGFVLLLKAAGLTIGDAFVVTFTDRMIMMFFWTTMGLFCGYPILRDEVRRRFFVRRR